MGDHKRRRGKERKGKSREAERKRRGKCEIRRETEKRALRLKAEGKSDWGGGAGLVS